MGSEYDIQSSMVLSLFFLYCSNVKFSLALGTLLINERMLETYVIARDRFLQPNGKMFPGVGR